MKRFYRHIVTMGLAAACYGQPAPPAPPAAPAPAAAPQSPFFPEKADLDEMKTRMDEVKMRMDEAAARVRETVDIDVKDVEVQVQMAMQKARAMADRDFDFDFHFDFEKPMLYAQAAPKPKPMTAPMPPEPPSVYIKRGRGGDSEERLYRRGTEYLDRRDWEKAIDEFDNAIEKKGAKADGAFYWKAYALSKLGKREQALATLAELRKSYPSSRWLNDAKALEAEVQQASGTGPSPETQSDEELKLFAINSLMNTDPERALPLLEKILQKSTSPKLKERALFVLAQNRSSKSNEIVSQFARGGGNPDLQQKAVEYLGVYGGRENLQTLGDIYAGSSDPGLKRSILRSFMVARDKDRLVAAAKSEQNADVRRDAIQYLGNLNAYPELGQLYSSEQSGEVKESIIQSMANSGNTDRLVEIAKTEKDPKLREAAVRRLGHMGRTKTSEALVSLYGSETDRNVKERIINALFEQGSAKELVDVARKETDPELKKNAVHRLSNMKSKEATDFFLELLNK
jgi:HEAT repeat protein